MMIELYCIVQYWPVCFTITGADQIIHRKCTKNVGNYIIIVATTGGRGDHDRRAGGEADGEAEVKQHEVAAEG